MDNCFNENFPSFDPLNSEFSSGCRIINTFSNCFSFHSFNKCNKDSFKSYVYRLDELAIESLNNPSHALVIMDTSIKNNIATSISYMHIYNKPITKTLHHMINVSSTEAKLFAIRCGINQSTNSSGISKIIVVTNSIHAVKNSLTHLPILTRTTQFLFLRNFELFSLAIRRTQSNSGNFPVIAISLSIKWLTLRPNHSILSHSFLANHLEISAKRKNVTSSLTDRR